MKASQFLAVVCFAALLAVAVVPTARADAIDQETTVTFSQPVEVPDLVLPAGKYVFQLADTVGSRDVMQIWNADRTHLYTMVVGIPTERMQSTDKPVFTFERLAPGSPEAIHAWFYPGELDGIQFTYSNSHAAEHAHLGHPTTKAHKG